MAIRTFSAQKSFREGGVESRKKLKKVRSVKVANLDRLRSSMRREKSRFNRGVVASSDDASVISGSSSAALSGTSSPNYMKATSSSARKGSVQAISDDLQSSSASKIDIRTSSTNSPSKLSRVSEQEFSGPAGVNKIKAGKSLKRVPSLKQSKKLSSKKSMKIREKYSQFSDVGINPDEMLDFGILGFQDNTDIIDGGMKIDPECLNVSASHGQDSIGKMRIVKQKGILERSSSRKMIRLKSIRSSRTRQRPQSRFSGGATELMSYEAEVSNAEPHYMKGTSSQEKRKNSAKGLTRTSSLRPLRILAKIPSLRPKRNKVRKRPQVTPLSGKGVDRATCSSTLKRTEVPDETELHSRGQESERASSLHLCPYSYCSIHAHRHHTPTQPLTEFISAKRKLFSNQKGEKSDSQSKGEVEHYTSSTESNHSRESRQISSDESYALQEVMNATTKNALEADENGIDFLIKIYAKPRKKWATEDTLSEEAEELNGSTYDQISVGDYDGKKADTLSETSDPEEMQRTLNDDQQENYEIFNGCNVDTNDITLQQTLELPDNGPKSVSVNKELESSIAEEDLQDYSNNPFHFANRESEVSPGDDLINILSDKRKYTSMWQLIHQQLLSSEASTNEAQEDIQADEKESGDGNSSHEMSNLDLEQSNYSNNLKEDVDDQVAETQKLELHQTTAIKLVQEAVNAILQHDAESYTQQSNPDKEMANDSAVEEISTPTAPFRENYREDGEIDGNEMSLGSAEKHNKMKQIGNRLLQQKPDEKGMSGRQMSKSFSRLKKLFMTAKFIKAMERLKKINPRKPQYLSAESASENERIYLRHLSMNKTKNTEEWMLDNALRKVISRLDPDQQRRVARLVEAFETVNPEQEENTNRPYPVTSEPAPGCKVANLVIEEEKNKFVEPEQDTTVSHKQFLPKKDEGVLVSQKDVPEEKCSGEDSEYQANTTGEKILQDSIEMNSADVNSVFSTPSSTFVDGDVSTEDPIDTPKVSSEFPTGDSEVSLGGDMTSIFLNKQQYTGMWNLIYQHAVSNEASVDEKQKFNDFDEENQGDTISCREMNDREIIPSSFSMDQKEDEDNQSAASEKPEVDQSAAIKLVKEALSAILQRYEQPPQLQSIPDLHMAADDATDLYISTSTPCTQEDSIERVKNAEKHGYIDLEDKMHPVENTSLPLQQQMESDELKAPPRKISKSLSKLKKAIATTRFIKAMERLTKNSPRRSQNLRSDTISEEERVYLRHRSMDGRKKGEEWMLDYALRQVISNMDPDQQRRVALIVKAFETVHPEQREKNIRCYPREGEAVGNNVLDTSTNELKECYLESQQKKLKSIEQIPITQDNRNLLPCREALQERCLQEHHAQQTSLADDIFLQDKNEAVISKSTLKLSEDSSRLSSMVVTPEEPNIQDEETWRAFKHSSPFPTGNSEVRPDGDMANILLDKQKYTSMWSLIHQHVLSNEATTTRKQEVSEVDEEEGDDAKTCQAINDPDPNQSNQLKKSKVDEDNHSAAFDQSAAINLVKEAINAILQCHEQKSSQQSCEEHGRAADSARELCDKTALDSTKDDSEGKSVEKNKISEPEKKLYEEENTSAPTQQQVEPNEASKDPRKMSKSLSKLKKAIVTTKFIKAMERLRKINPRKPRLLPQEVASEEERVYLRHLSINGRKNDEEWMLDYALRKVLSNLAPDQQRKVALLVEAFETVHPEKKGIRFQMKSDLDSATGSVSTGDQKRIPESKLQSSMANNDIIPPKRYDELDKLGKDSTLEKGVQDHSMEFSNLRTELSHKIFDSDYSNSHSHHQASLKGSPISDEQLHILTEREEMDVNPMHGAFQHTNDFEQESNANKFDGILSDNQKNSGMWHLIYQHVKSVGTSEAGSKLSKRQTEEDQVNRSGASSDTDADADDSDASSTTSELTESDAIKLVKEAINNILDAPHIVEDKLTSSDNRTALESQSIEVEENSKKSLSRGYSKLRKIIICNKFIKAMEKTQKFYPQTGRALNPGSEARKAHLKNCGVGDRKGMDEWMLDNVLQKVIAGLAPVQQKRVSLLVKAFEKVKPDPEERVKELNSSKRNTKEMEEAVSSDSLQSLELPGGFDLKLDRSQTSSPEVVTERVLQESGKDRSPGLTKEYALNRESCNSGDPCDNNSATSDAIRTLSGTCKDLTEIEATDAPSVSLEESASFKDEAGAQVEEKTLIDEQEVGNTKFAFKFAKKPPQLEDLEDEWNYSAQNSRSLEKPTGLWGLILQHVSVDMLEKNEAQKTTEIETNVQVGSSSTEVSERKTNDSSQLSSRVKSCRDMGVQTPTSFEFEENEAIKLVEEAVEEMLLIQDQICDAESVTSSTTAEKGVNSQNNGSVSDPSCTATETAGVATSLQTAATLEEEKEPSKETVPSSYNTLSKVVMCRRFIKGMNKMRKLKALDAQGLSQLQGEDNPSLRQISTRGKASWEEGMLDNALQKVIGNLAPAKKQRVALLVQAFETVGSQPEPISSWRGKLSS